MLEGYIGFINSVAFSPNGALLTSASHDKTVQLWDTATGAALHMLEGYIGSVISVAFSPNGALLASALHDNTVRLWDTATGTVLKMIVLTLYIDTLFFNLDRLFLKINRDLLYLDSL